MNKTMAKCLYGFAKNVPVYAQVQIVSADGTSRVTTAVLKEDGDNLKLGVYGITFSNPTIKVKLLEEGVPVPSATPTPVAFATPTPVVTPTPIASVAPTPVASATPTPIAAVPVVMKKTIVCVKGKVVKNVTAVSPKCPAGYKVKK
jgi:hypothetical protein